MMYSHQPLFALLLLFYFPLTIHTHPPFNVGPFTGKDCIAYHQGPPTRLSSIESRQAAGGLPPPTACTMRSTAFFFICFIIRSRESVRFCRCRSSAIELNGNRSVLSLGRIDSIQRNGLELRRSVRSIEGHPLVRLYKESNPVERCV